MKNYITKSVPRIAFAAAIVLGASLTAEEAASQGTGGSEQQRQSQQSSGAIDRTATESASQQANLRPMTASEVLGMSIDSAENEKIGEIDEIYVDSETGEVLALVVSTGGFLGFRQQQSLISPGDLRFNAERTVMHTEISKDQIQNAPRYEKGETDNFDQVRPIGATASDWEDSRRTGQATGEERTQRSERSEGGRDVGDRQATGEERTQRSERQATGEERTQRSDRQATGEERTQRSDRQASGEERTQRSERSTGGQAQARSQAVSELLEMSVENRQGESIGDVDEAFLDIGNWEVAGVVVSTGGFLGIGDRKTLFGLQEMSFDASNEKLVLEYNREQIGEFPEFKPDDQSVFEDLRERIDNLGSSGSRSAAVDQ